MLCYHVIHVNVIHVPKSYPCYVIMLSMLMLSMFLYMAECLETESLK